MLPPRFSPFIPLEILAGAIIPTPSCYRPSVISVKDTKARLYKSSGLYRISGTIGQGVAELRG